MTERLTTRPPHPIAEILWMAWLANALAAIFTEWPTTVAPPAWEDGSLTGVVLVSFFVLEFAGWAKSRGRPWSATLSEVVWWRIPWWPVRWLFGMLLAVAAFALVSRAAGAVLLMWLGSHFAFRESQGRGPAIATTTPLRDIQGDLDEVRRRAAESSDGVE